MDKFQVVVWCESCAGDDEGCFGGASEVIGEAFETREQAEKAGAQTSHTNTASHSRADAR